MKKSILIIILTIIVVDAIIFSFHQKQRANHFHNLAEIYTREIQVMRDQAEEVDEV